MPKLNLTPYQYAALYNPFTHFAFYAGVACGKSYTGSHFAIRMIREHPDLTGFIGANTYDQLSQATLREFFFWLEEYGFDYVVDRRPPDAWGYKRALKKYSNTVHVRNPKNGKVTLIFTRVLSDENPLRGIEFSWYWLDESRDTPEATHDVVLSRLRESDFVKGLITTTPNGEDWSYERFVRNTKPGDKLYGSMHVATVESLKAGIITEQYYQTMRRSYSELMALQELDAQHVNVKGGRAYYAAGPQNRGQCPWGWQQPNEDYPLVIGCDFNFQPAPCVWMVGQLNPEGSRIHWFDEIKLTEASTPRMTMELLTRYPGFFYRVFGDASGTRGTTSNAGENDYAQMAEVFAVNGCGYSIDTDQANPRVRDRIENMNRLLKNAAGEVTMTYDPQRCQLFDKDMKMVGWKKLTAGLSSQGRLDDGGDVQLTHASDGGGYAVWKLFPYARRVGVGSSIASPNRPY